LTTKTHSNNTKDDERWGNNKKTIIQTRNHKMAKNNLIRVPKRHMKNTKGIKLDMIFYFFGQ
jgi:hypothetical protein